MFKKHYLYRKPSYAGLDRKSSRGMLYENEELRLKTININAEIERGQSDIKKLRRENEMLKKEIWSLRDEYEKLDKLLQEKQVHFSSSASSSSSDTESIGTAGDELAPVETSQNFENVQKTNMKHLHTEFDHLSVVPEENSTDNSDKNSMRNSMPDQDIIKPDQSYPSSSTKFVPKQLFSAINVQKSSTPGPSYDYLNYNTPAELNNTFQRTNVDYRYSEQQTLPSIAKTSSDIIVKTDNQNFMSSHQSNSTFSNGGNLEELLNDIECISQDILTISTTCDEPKAISHKSELNVVLMPAPMPLLGFEKYQNLGASVTNLHTLPTPFDFADSSSEAPIVDVSNSANFGPLPLPILSERVSPQVEEKKPFNIGKLPDIPPNCNRLEVPKQQQLSESNTNALLNSKEQRLQITDSKLNLLETSSIEQNLSASDNEDKKPNGIKTVPKNEEKHNTSIKKKLCIHFKGHAKDKSKKQDESDKKSGSKTPGSEKFNFFDLKSSLRPPSDLKTNQGKLMHQKSTESRKSGECNANDAKQNKHSSSEVKTSGSERNSETKIGDQKQQRTSVSISPDKKQPKQTKDDTKQTHKKQKKLERLKQRRNTLSMERLPRERSFSVCTDRSNLFEHRLLNQNCNMYDDFASDRERTNSVSSAGTAARIRKMSEYSNFPMTGKIPWCGCWGNGCL